MFNRTATMILGLAIAAANVASAASVLTTPAVMTGSGEVKKCSVLNVGTKPVTVDVENIRAENGTVFDSTPNCTVDLGLQACTASDFGIGANYCRFTLIKGSKKSIRATLGLSSGGTDKVVLLAQ